MLTIQNQYSDLIQGVLACSQMRTFPEGTTFRQKEIKGNHYWYARLPNGKERYVGKNSPEILEAINNEKRLAGLYRENNALVKSLVSNGFPVPGQMMAKTVRALSDAGFFRLRGVLIGTLAYQTYFPLFGELPERIAGKLSVAIKSATRTTDMDFAMFHSISVAIDDKMDVSFFKTISESIPFEQRLDSLGKPIPTWIDRNTGLVVDLLSPLCNADDDEEVFLPSIDATSIKLKFLDFLIYDEIAAALLSNFGIAVNVPRPNRFAIHKFIVSQERKHPIKQEKDMVQAIVLSQHLLENDRETLLDSLDEAYGRGAGWRKRIDRAFQSPLIPKKILDEFQNRIGQKTFSIPHISM